MSLAEFKKLNKSSKEVFESLVEEVEKSHQSMSRDERMWRLTQDENGNGSAIIRFLPAPKGEKTPWAKYWYHFFKGKTGKAYSNKSRTSLGETDPASEYNSLLWNSEVQVNRDTVSKFQKRKVTYVSNIYVISDPKNPENEGKVFLMQYGKTIFDMIESAIKPQFEDEKPFNPFHFLEGANFKMKIFKDEKSGFNDYSKSKFDEPSPLLDGDEEKLYKIWEKEYSLAEFLDPSTFKSYAELKAELESVVGTKLDLSQENISEASGEEVPDKDLEFASIVGEDSGSDDKESELSDTLARLIG